MMTAPSQPAAEFLTAWHDALRAAGWEAISSEALGEVAARLERGNAVWSLVIDRAARFKFTAERPLASEAWSEVEVDGRLYAGHHEYQHIVTVTGLIEPGLSPDELLADMAHVAEAPPLAA